MLPAGRHDQCHCCGGNREQGDQADGLSPSGLGRPPDFNDQAPQGVFPIFQLRTSLTVATKSRRAFPYEPGPGQRQWVHKVEVGESVPLGRFGVSSRSQPVLPVVFGRQPEPWSDRTGGRMPRIVRMPTRQELPRGATRDFVEELFDCYREAHRPTLREISRQIENSDSAATASPETIRRMLRGTTVPSWPIVQAVFYALCEMGNVDPYLCRDNGYSDGRSRRQMIEIRWNKALDQPEPQPAVRSGFAQPDPWASSAPDAGGGFSDEPPF